MGWLLFYTFLLGLGTFLSTIAYVEYRTTRELLYNGEKVNAVVKEYSVSLGNSRTMYRPIFEYRDAKNKVRTYKNPVSSYPPPYEIGEKVTLVYEKNGRKKVRILSFWGLYSAPVILLMVASPLLVIGASYLLYRLY